ncbi:hypothetical protein OF83DRAFT_618728 [Amylostereum chailletii]|nr:hypothetical protein OF83DRAFT_618728 [Amylostereum chailletii]
MSSTAVARARRREDVEKAYDIQTKAALTGAAQYGAVGFGALTVAHYTWPAFRRQTLALKGFLLTTFAIYGMVMHAEDALQSHESVQRKAEHDIRREARIDLTRRGLVATESEILKWRAERERPSEP